MSNRFKLADGTWSNASENDPEDDLGDDDDQSFIYKFDDHLEAPMVCDWCGMTTTAITFVHDYWLCKDCYALTNNGHALRSLDEDHDEDLRWSSRPTTPKIATLFCAYCGLSIDAEDAFLLNDIEPASEGVICRSCEAILDSPSRPFKSYRRKRQRDIKKATQKALANPAITTTRYTYKGSKANSFYGSRRADFYGSYGLYGGFKDDNLPASKKPYLLVFNVKEHRCITHQK